MTELTSRGQAKRAAIHTAAQELFTRQGFESTSMDAIAQAANVSKQTLYRYYQNKEALFIETVRQVVFEQTSTPTFAALRATPIVNRPVLEQALLTWAQAMLEQGLQPAFLALLRVLIAETPRFPFLGSLYLSTIAQEGRAIITALLESASSHGVIPAVDLDVVLPLFVGSVLLHIFGALFTPESPPPPSPEHLAALVRLFLAGIVCSSP